MAKDPETRTAAYKAHQARRRAAETAHNERMTRIAERGGTTLAVVRAMSPKNKDAFIFENRDGGPNDV